MLTAPTRFHEKPPSKQAGMLCSNQKFQRWLKAAYPAEWAMCGDGTGATTAASVVRLLCDVDSRRDLDAEPGRTAWGEVLRAWVDFDTGRLA